MAVVDDVDGAVAQFWFAQGALVNGNPAPVQALWSHRDDVTLANPLGPAVRGWDQVAATVERAAAQFSAGELVGVEIVAQVVTPALAYLVALERFAAKVGGREEITPVVLRATMILRPEDGVWKLVHRECKISGVNDMSLIT